MNGAGINGIEQLLTPKSKLENAMMRTESIVVLPYNTIRMVDAPIQSALYRFAGIEMPHMERHLYELCTRETRDLATYDQLDKPTTDAYIKRFYKEFYDIAPITDMYTVFEILKKQRFVKSITALHDHLGVVENSELFENEYYDGDYESLVDWLENHTWTALALDDVYLLDKLTANPRLTFNQKSIFLSKMGYNYYTGDNNIPILRCFENIRQRHFMDLKVFELYKFSPNALKETLDEGDNK